MGETPPPEPRLSADPLSALPAEALPTADPPVGWRARLRSARADFTPLRTSRDFRLLFFGGGISFLGSMVTYVAVPFQVFALTGSSLVVGLLGAGELVPLVFFGLYGGALADAMDRRALVLGSEAGLAVVSSLLLVNALLPHPHVWPIFVAASLAASLDGIQRPSLDALTPRIVAHDEVTAAAALSTLRMTVGTIAGPAIGGVLVATSGVASAYAVDLATFSASLAALVAMRAVPPPSGAEKPSLRGILDGLSYAMSRQELLGTYVVDMAAMFFAMPMALFPAFAGRVLEQPWSLGLLYTAGSVGAFLASITSGWTSHVHRHGRAVAIAAMCWGLAITGFGLAPNIWVAVALLAVAGSADMVSGVFRMTMWNQTIPDELRGRLAGIELLSYSTGPLLGNTRAGGVAALWSVRGSVVSGGVLCFGSVLALVSFMSKFRTYDARTDVHARRERERRARRETT